MSGAGRASTLCESVRVLGFGGQYDTARTAQQSPEGRVADLAGQLPRTQRLLDSAADFTLEIGLGREQNAHPDVVILGPLDGAVVRRERAGRRVLLAAAQRDRDRRPRGCGIRVSFHREERVVGEWLAHQHSLTLELRSDGQSPPAASGISAATRSRTLYPVLRRPRHPAWRPRAAVPHSPGNSQRWLRHPSRPR